MTSRVELKRCPYCGTDQPVLSSVRFTNMESCRLSCGHVAASMIDETFATRALRGAYNRSNEESMNLLNALGSERKCPSCGELFRGFTSGATGKFCFPCRGDFGLITDKDAEELMVALDAVPQAGRTEMRQMAKNKRSRGYRVTHVPAPKADPAVVACAIRAMTDYGLTVPLPERINNPTAYAIAKNGLFEVRDTDIARIILPVAAAPKDGTNHRAVSGLTEELQAGVTLRLPKIPFEMLAQTVAFFRGVCKEAKGSSEAIVRIWWDATERRYEIRVPEGEQQVSGASVRHFDNFNLDDERDENGVPRYIMVMDIHSHGSTMTAFWSGVDDGDERRCSEGRMFGVIGKCTQPIPEWKWRMRAREGFIEMNVADIFETRELAAIPFTVTMDVMLRAMSHTDGSKDGQVRLLCPVDPFIDVTFPDAWMTQVQHAGRGSSSHHGQDFRVHGSVARHGSHGDGTRLSTAGHFIYIRNGDGKLEEFEIDPVAGMRTTGKFLDTSTMKVH